MRRKCVLFVHGIGPQQKGYSDALWDQLWNDRPPDDVHKYEMFYSDIYETMNTKTDIEKLPRRLGLIGALRQIPVVGALATVADEKLTAFLRDTVSHVLYFTLYQDARIVIVNKFKEKLLELVKDATDAGVYPRRINLTIISHSLGTAVAYLGMHDIIGNPALGLSAGLKARTLFTLASPLALIRDVSARVGMAVPHITGGIIRPRRRNPAKKTYQYNIGNWYSYRDEKDPVASLVPFKAGFLASTDDPPFAFSETHGSSAHAFSNYIEQARDRITSRIAGE